MSTIRRRGLKVTAALAALSLLAACGQPAKTSTSGVGDTEVATGGRLFATADEATAKLGSSAEPGVFPRTVVHALGETKLEKKPERVIVLDSGELDDVLALGIKPVGMATTAGQSGAPAYLADKAAGIATVGEINNLNLEAIAALNPDLIVGSKLRANDLYKNLSEIAPTVFSIRPGFPWKENLLLVGDSLGEEGKATALLNDYQKRAEAVKAAVGATPPTISLVRFLSGNIRLYGNLSFIGVILKDIGLPRPEIQNIDELAVQVSKEQIDKADADWIFYSSYGAGPSPDEKSVTAGGLWQGMGAVKTGHALAVTDETWFLGLGPIGAGKVLDDLTRILAKK